MDTGSRGSKRSFERSGCPMISVLRLGHRPERDKRVTTHVALVARCFGASTITITTRDDALSERIRKVALNFGGEFSVNYVHDWKKFLRDFHGQKVHLTMYGEKLADVRERIDSSGDMLVVVGSEKVPAELYDMCDLNVAIGNQPHSEVSALALFLDRVTDGKWERADMGGKLRIRPTPRGKTVLGRR